MTIRATIIQNLADIVVEGKVIPCNLLVLVQENKPGDVLSATRAYYGNMTPVYEIIGLGDKPWEVINQDPKEFAEELKKCKNPLAWHLKEGAIQKIEELVFDDTKRLDRYVQRLLERSI